MRRAIRIALLFVTLIGASLSAPTSEAQAPLSVVSQPLNTRTEDGQLVCNTSGAFSQVPGHPDLFVGRGLGVGDLDYCHRLRTPRSFLAIFKMDWHQPELVLQSYLVKGPIKTTSGIALTAAADPYVARYKGTLWVAFECLPPAAVSTCVAPLSDALDGMDLSRLSVVAGGVAGPREGSMQVVTLSSASAPMFLNFNGKLFLYWQVDHFDNSKPENTLVTRGMQVEVGADGRLWGVGSIGKPVPADGSSLAPIVLNVDQKDPTRNHVAVVSDLAVVGKQIVVVSSIGGTAGRQVCRSPHDDSRGCWRIGLSVSDTPLGYNVFGEKPIPNVSLPTGVVAYPRFIIGPEGKRLLIGHFLPPTALPMAAAAAVDGRTISKGIRFLPFDPSSILGQQ